MSNTTESSRRSYWTTVSRGWRLRCPRCGEGRLFESMFRMRSDCEVCNLHYEREPGYFLGSIYINYGLTAVLVTLFYFALFFSGRVPPQVGLWIVTAFALLFPMWFFRYARSLWLGFDHYWDPLSEQAKSTDDTPVGGTSSK